MSASTPGAPPKTGRIFDRFGVAVNGTSMGGRTTTCWRWADGEGIRVIDEHVAWGATANEQRPPELEEAIRECIAEHSALIVYCLDVISEDPAAVEQVRRELGSSPIRVATETPEANEEAARGEAQEDGAS